VNDPVFEPERRLQLVKGIMPVNSKDKWKQIITGASGDPEIEEAFVAVLREMYETFCKKQKDYGRGNIGKFQELGVVVRTSDKIERLINLRVKNAKATPNNEAIDDTWIDIATYGAIGLMCRRGQWT
jgi:hypothetical protein